MLFTSPLFLLVFCPLAILIHYLLPDKYKNLFILLSSLLFYSWGEPYYVFSMIAIILVTWIGALKIKSTDGKSFFIFPILLILFHLFFFKYSTFILVNLGIDTENLNFLNSLTLPLGISFYSFQAISYLIDIKQNKTKDSASLVQLGAYLSLFPQLIAGPIVRYNQIKAKLKERKVDFNLLNRGVEKFIIGLCKKVLIADQFAIIVAHIYGTDTSLIPWYFILIGIVFYSFQIYYDFSGYTDMALGLGLMLGFKLPENFNFPYSATSIRDFWRRWHITLSEWFRDYIYIPLGGSRKSRFLTFRNLLIVFFLTGLWHGAGWNFILWGMIHGGFIILERITKYDSIPIPNFIRWSYTFTVVTLSWIFFYNSSIVDSFTLLKNLFSFNHGVQFELFTSFNNLRVTLIGFGLFFAFAIFKPIYEIPFNYLNAKCRIVIQFLYVFLFCFCLAIISANNFSPFIYFRF